jgi:phosphotransferase system enzyme I (PtsP)
MLMALGYRRLSMQPARVAPIKRLARSIDLAKVAPRVQAAMDGGDASLRNELLSISNEFDLKI